MAPGKAPDDRRRIGGMSVRSACTSEKALGGPRAHKVAEIALL